MCGNYTTSILLGFTRYFLDCNDLRIKKKELYCLSSVQVKIQAYYLADNVINRFEKSLKIVYLANFNSSVLSSGAVEILEGYSKLNKPNTSALVILYEFNKGFPELVETFKKVVNNLSKFIGDLSCPVNDALDNFSCTLVHFQTEFLIVDSLGNRQKVDYKPVIENGQMVNVCRMRCTRLWL